MKALIFAYGTRGDVQPCVALARAMREAGHDPVVAGPESSGSLAAVHGIRFAPLDNGLTRLWDNPQAYRATEAKSGARGLPALRAAAESLRRPAIPSVRTILEDAWAAAQGADLIVHNGPLLVSASHHIAEKLRVPLILSQMYPLFAATGAFPTALYRFPGAERWPAVLTRATYRAMLSMLRGLTDGAVESWREQALRLPRRRGRYDVLRRRDGRPVPVINAVSPYILPPPADWPAWVHTTGYWQLPRAYGWTPPRELADFLAAGKPPVYVGFGSMVSGDPKRTGRLVADAVRRAGARAILATGWGGLDARDLPPEVFVIDAAPHDWLFTRVAAVVHHGGPGTAAAAIAAGRPQIICPFMADQPFWGDRMHRLGIAPAPTPQSDLTSRGLAEAIQNVARDALMSERAEILGRLVRAEDGTAAAVALLEKICDRQPDW